MIDTIQDLIDHLEAVKKQAGNIHVRVRIQIPFVVPVATSIEDLEAVGSKTGVLMLIIHGYKKG